MAYQTPLSTLSAALTQLPIAPELMGNEGLPPIRPTEGTAGEVEPHPVASNQLNGNYPNYASSSVRGDIGVGVGGGNSIGVGVGVDVNAGEATNDQASWGYDQSADPQSWDPIYQTAYPTTADSSSLPIDTQPQPNPTSTLPLDTESIPNLKRKRRTPNPNAKPRPPKRTLDTDDPLSNPDSVEYEHPSKDIRLGAVFVHPPEGSVQACVRCHRIKRKCEGGKPRCQGCEKADVACVFELNGATSSYVHTLKEENLNLITQIASAHERITQLESLLQQPHASGSGNGNGIGVQYPLDPQLDHDMGDGAGDVKGDYSNLAELAKVDSTESGDGGFGAIGKVVLGLALDDSKSGDEDIGVYPPLAGARQAVVRFFKMNGELVFTNEEEFRRDMEGLYARFGSGEVVEEKSGQWRRKELGLWLVLSLGEDGVDESAARGYWERAMRGLQKAVGKEDLNLLFLTIYGLHHPTHISPIYTLALATRIALSLNLHRKVTNDETSEEEQEKRRRLLWGLYVLDRRMAASFGGVVGFEDAIIDVEFPKTDTAIHATLSYYRILFNIYTTMSSRVTPTQAHLDDLYAPLEKWYSSIPDNATNHFRYYYALLLLHRPRSAEQARLNVFNSAVMSPGGSLESVKGGGGNMVLDVVERYRVGTAILYSMTQGLELKDGMERAVGICETGGKGDGKWGKEVDVVKGVFEELKSLVESGLGVEENKERGKGAVAGLWGSQ